MGCLLRYYIICSFFKNRNARSCQSTSHTLLQNIPMRRPQSRLVTLIEWDGLGQPYFLTGEDRSLRAAFEQLWEKENRLAVAIGLKLHSDENSIQKQPVCHVLPTSRGLRFARDFRTMRQVISMILHWTLESIFLVSWMTCYMQLIALLCVKNFCDLHLW